MIRVCARCGFTGHLPGEFVSVGFVGEPEFAEVFIGASDETAGESVDLCGGCGRELARLPFEALVRVVSLLLVSQLLGSLDGSVRAVS